MDVQSCKSCGTVFTGKKPGLCSKCKEQELEDLQVVTDALRDDPGQSVDGLSEKTGVEEKRILKFVREGKIASDAVVGNVTCGRCGKPAQSLAVRLCQKCSADLNKASTVPPNVSTGASKRAETHRDDVSARGPGAVSDDESRRIHDAVRDRRY